MCIVLFRLQKYKKFESNSQLFLCFFHLLLCCFDCKSTKNLRAIHNSAKITLMETMLFRLQKYKKFESNSQQGGRVCLSGFSCFDCKSTKNLRAIHNLPIANNYIRRLFRLQKYKKFESNSQQLLLFVSLLLGCFDCKSTKNLRAIHNCGRRQG